MIRSKKELKEYLDYEKKLYINGGIFDEIKLFLLKDSDYLIWHYIKMLRYTEYYYNKNNKLLYWIFQRKKNKEGALLGFTIYHNCIDKGLKIYHYGNIVINSHSKIGKNFKLHGNNCVGNKGEHDKNNAPKIGNNVDMGFGSQILGKVSIASNTIIASNAIVVKDLKEENCVMGGIPSKILKKQEK